MSEPDIIANTKTLLKKPNWAVYLNGCLASICTNTENCRVFIPRNGEWHHARNRVVNIRSVHHNCEKIPHYIGYYMPLEVTLPLAPMSLPPLKEWYFR